MCAEHIARDKCSGASALGRFAAPRVCGLMGKGATLPLASGRMADKRSAVRQNACLPVLETATSSAPSEQVSL